MPVTTSKITPKLLSVIELPALRESVFRGETTFDTWKRTVGNTVQTGASVVFKGKTYDLTDFALHEREGDDPVPFTVVESKKTETFASLCDRSGLSDADLMEKLSLSKTTLRMYKTMNKPSVSAREAIKIYVRP